MRCRKCGEARHRGIPCAVFVVDPPEGGEVEELAAYAHDAWSGWMSYMFSKGTAGEDGSMVIPKWAVDRWGRQAATASSEVPAEEKASDRAEAAKMQSIVDRWRGRGWSPEESP